MGSVIYFKYVGIYNKNSLYKYIGEYIGRQIWLMIKLNPPMNQLI